jgi:hypothetical protein
MKIVVEWYMKLWRGTQLVLMIMVLTRADVLLWKMLLWSTNDECATRHDLAFNRRDWSCMEYHTGDSAPHGGRQLSVHWSDRCHMGWLTRGEGRGRHRHSPNEIGNTEFTQVQPLRFGGENLLLLVWIYLIVSYRGSMEARCRLGDWGGVYAAIA